MKRGGPRTVLNGALDFSRWTRNADAGIAIDPYTLWALQTGFRQFAKDKGDGIERARYLDFLVELDRPLDDLLPAWAGPAGRLQLVVPPIYFQAIPGPVRRGGGVLAHHITCRLDLQPGRLQAFCDDAAQLLALEGVRRVQIGFPRPALDDEPKDEPPPGSRAPPRATAAPAVVLGVLEDGCPFGHAALLRGNGSTRVQALWDQSVQARHDPKEAPAGLGYGRQRTHQQLQALLAQAADGAGGSDEEALYADPACLQRGLRDEASHAAGVALLMAGSLALTPSMLSTEQARPPRPDTDPASTAPVVAVQFPFEQAEVAGARWLMVRALDGLRYLCQQAAALVPAHTAAPPLAINMSYGSVVGAHDGTGLLESAMDELVQAYGPLGIVLAAGNSHGRKRDPEDPFQRQPSGFHAEATLPKGGHTVVRLYVPPNKPIETYLELWFEQENLAFEAEQFLDRDDVSIEVQSPTGQRLKVGGRRRFAFDLPCAEQVGVGLFSFQRVAQSRLRSMALLVVAATQISTRRVEVPAGEWRVTINNRGPRKLRVQAWVERDMVARTGRFDQAARLLPGGDGETEVAKPTDRNTFNNIATSQHVFRAGALLARGDASDPRPSAYSSAAGPRPAAPEFSAVADESDASPGVRVSGNLSGSVLRMNGTSVSAPQAARWLANQLAWGQTLAQVRKKIRNPGNTPRRGFVIPPRRGP